MNQLCSRNYCILKSHCDKNNQNLLLVFRKVLVLLWYNTCSKQVKSRKLYDTHNNVLARFFYNVKRWCCLAIYRYARVYRCVKHFHQTFLRDHVYFSKGIGPFRLDQGVCLYVSLRNILRFKRGGADCSILLHLVTEIDIYEVRDISLSDIVLFKDDP